MEKLQQPHPGCLRIKRI